jgi:hypothetical protein
LRILKIFFIAVILLQFFIPVSYSQNINIYQENPNSFQFDLEKIWNVTIVNLTSPLDIYLIGSIESVDSKLLFMAQTSDFILQSGTRKVSFNSINLENKKEYSNDIIKDKNGKSTLPNGKYNVCVSVLAKETNKVICSSSSIYEIVNFSQPKLISPLNREVLNGKFPVFNWQPFSNNSMGKNITYEIIIVKIHKGQTPQEAIQINPVLIKKNNIKSESFEFPIRESILKEGNIYAWMVKSIIDYKIISESEIWEFEYSNDYKNNSTIENNVNSNNNKDSISFLNYDNKNNSELLIGSTNNYENLSLDENKLNIFKGHKRLLNQSNNSITTLYLNQNYCLNDRLKESAGYQKDNEILFQFFSSYNTINYQFSNRKNVDSELPRNFFNLAFNPIFVFHDIPFSFNLYYDTKQNDIRQNINSFTFRLEPRILNDIIHKKSLRSNKVKGYLKFLSDFDVLSFGEVFPYYSKYTLSSSNLTGIDIKYSPGLLYLAFSGLNNLKAIEGFNYARKILAGKIGIGGERDNHFHFTILKAWDDENSLTPENTTNGTKPQENFLLGTDAKLVLLNERLILEGEIAGSIHTRDKTSAIVEGEDVPDFLKFIIDPRISTSVDYMYILKSILKIDKTDTKLSGTFKSIGPGYTSLGALNLRNDVRGFNIKIEQMFLDRRIHLSAAMEREKNNVGSYNSTTETMDNFSFNMKLNFKNFPFITLDYRPYTITNNEDVDSLLINNRSSVFTIMTGVNDFNEDFYYLTNLLISSINSKSTQDINDYQILSFIISNDLSFVNYPLSFAGSIGYTFNNAINKSHILSFDLSSSYTFFNIMNTSLGFNYTSERNKNHKIGIHFSTSLPIWEIGELYLRAEQNFYREKIFEYGNNDELILNISISKDWKLW